MNVRLHANQSVSRLDKQLRDAGGPLAVTELDLTNCICVDGKELAAVVSRYKLIRYLRCAACAVEPSDVFRFLTLHLPNLVEAEFTLAAPIISADDELSEVYRIVNTEDGLAVHMRRVYLEISSEHGLLFLLTLMRYCPNAKHLHVHLVSGDFNKTVQECRALLATHRCLETFTFTSEVPSPAQRDPTHPFDLATYAAVCANVIYQSSTNFWNCVRIWDLARADAQPLVLPFQVVLVAVVDQGLTQEWISLASITNTWVQVRELCLLLFPKDSSMYYPAADGTYRDCLRELCVRLQNIVELNVSAFHFGPDLDVTALLQNGSLKFLQSLSAPPCGFRRVFALRCLALGCPDFKELDVRFERTSSVSRCMGCEGHSLLTTEGGTEFRDGASPVFRYGLTRLTLSGVHDVACTWFIKCCKPTATLRMSYCPSTLDYGRLYDALANRSAPTCLVLRHAGLRLDDTNLLANLRHFADMQYLYLLSETPLSDDAASCHVTLVARKLPELRCLHAHYRDLTGSSTDKTVTWVPQPGRVVLGGPCFLYCSTATFIGLAKPLGRDTQPTISLYRLRLGNWHE